MAKYPMIIVNQAIPLVLKLNPNPNSISIDRSKVFSQTQTLGGWVFEHWGENPRTMKVSGKTLVARGKTGVGLADVGNSLVGGGKSTDTAVEAALFGLQQAYNLDKRTIAGLGNVLTGENVRKVLSGNKPTLRALSTTFIYYKFDLYTGFFTNFSFSQDGEKNPRYYEYSFDFLVTATAQSTLVNSAMSTGIGGVGASLASLAKMSASGEIAPGLAVLAAGSVVSGLSELNIG